MGRKKKEDDDNTKKKSPSDRIKALLQSKFKKGAISTMDEIKDSIPTSTGSLRLDLALKIPFPAGLHMIYGVQGSGKTTLALESISEAQASGRYAVVMYVNMERAINKSIVATIEKLETKGALLAKPQNAEECGDIIVQTLRALQEDEKAFIVLDSVAAMEPEVVSSNSLSDATIAAEARIVTTMARKINILAADSESAVILINQTRQTISRFGGGKIRMPGGEALWFYCTQVVFLSISPFPPYGKRVNKEGTMFGRVVKAEIQKNRFTMPFFSVPLPIYFGKGIDRSYELAQLLLELDLAEQNGSWITVEKDNDLGEIKVQGIEQLCEIIRDDKKLQSVLRKKIISLYNAV